MWTRHSSKILCLAVGLTLLSILVRLMPEFHRLVLSDTRGAAVDLRLRHAEISRWFAGMPVYTSRGHAGYPPASYVLLYPFFGWLGESAARWLWGAVTVVELCALSFLAIRFTRTTVPMEKLLIFLTFFSAYPITVTLGNGQLGIHMFTLFWCAVLLLRNGTGWGVDLISSILLVFAAAKPSFSAPLYWVVLFALRRLRPVLLLICGYAAATVAALAFQPDPISRMWNDFLRVNGEVIGTEGGAHIGVWLRLLGLSDWTSVASIGMFSALGIWVYMNRRADIWLLLGVSGIVARIWTYHRMYDDLLVVFAMLALLRWIRSEAATEDGKIRAVLLLGVAWLALFIPASTVNYPFPYDLPYEIGLPIVWGAMLLLLVYLVRRDGRRYPGMERVSNHDFTW